MAKILEVIVTSVQEAKEAEAGGADRLELVRDLGVGGLTPASETVAAVLKAIRIPVRVMLRHSASMSAGGPGEVQALRTRAEHLSRFPIDGLVFGFIADGRVDEQTMAELASAAPHCRITFHRAFDELDDPLKAIQVLKQFPQIDRILTIGGTGAWEERMPRLIKWQRAASPGLKILAGAGLCRSVLLDLAKIPEIEEVHVGRAARVPQTVSGGVNQAAVRCLKSALQ